MDTWPDRALIVARDPELAADATALLTLNDAGLRALQDMLREAQESGDPIGLVVLDSLSRLKPPSVEESDNDQMAQWLDSLEAISLKFGVYILLIHHQGHNTARGRSEARSAGRGASAIGAVAHVTLLLEKTKDPRQLLLKVEGNFVLNSEITFEVAPPDAPAGAIYYFKPFDPHAIYDPKELVGEGEISTNEFAWRLSGKPRETGKNPPGASTRLAEKLRDRWEHEGTIEVTPGPRQA